MYACASIYTYACSTSASAIVSNFVNHDCIPTPPLTPTHSPSHAPSHSSSHSPLHSHSSALLVPFKVDGEPGKLKLPKSLRKHKASLPYGCLSVRQSADSVNRIRNTMAKSMCDAVSDALGAPVYGVL